jgi:hypothetical protein
MSQPRLGDYGLTEDLVAEIHAREQRQFEVFVRLSGWGCGMVWLALTIVVYARSARSSPLLGLAVAPFLGVLGAAVAALPITLVSGVLSLVACPRHPQAKALERYEAAAAETRPCDVCVLARGDHSPKRHVAYCGVCSAWLCADCRQRYDLRAIAALKRRLQEPASRDGPEALP